MANPVLCGNTIGTDFIGCTSDLYHHVQLEQFHVAYHHGTEGFVKDCACWSQLFQGPAFYRLSHDVGRRKYHSFPDYCHLFGVPAENDTRYDRRLNKRLKTRKDEK